MKVVGIQSLEPEIQETGARKLWFEIDYCERRLARLGKEERLLGRMILSVDEAIELLEEVVEAAERKRA